METDGIGDILLGTTTIAGLRRDHPNEEILYCVKAHISQWVKIFTDATKVVDKFNSKEIHTLYKPYSTYGKEVSTRSEKPRYSYYADHCKTTPAMPNYKISETALSWSEQYKDGILLAPFSHHGSRVWSLVNWLHLEDLLSKLNYKVYILDGPGNGARSRSFKGIRFWGQSPDNVAALIKKSKLLIGNDSAMAHLTGCLGCKGLVLCGPVDGKKIFGFYPGITTVNGPLPCNACYWRDRYYHQSPCNQFCANLNAITPFQVVEKVKELL